MVDKATLDMKCKGVGLGIQPDARQLSMGQPWEHQLHSGVLVKKTVSGLKALMLVMKHLAEEANRHGMKGAEEAAWLDAKRMWELTAATIAADEGATGVVAADEGGNARGEDGDGGDNDVLGKRRAKLGKGSTTRASAPSESRMGLSEYDQAARVSGETTITGSLAQEGAGGNGATSGWDGKRRQHGALGGVRFSRVQWSGSEWLQQLAPGYTTIKFRTIRKGGQPGQPCITASSAV
ncbi:hypothetical protein LX36DRAFT_727494 [Colletotrichum falcatum]|nr:hypothetical protein LX36DRAFT_727494 [Colletotrichum falcatum]